MMIDVNGCNPIHYAVLADSPECYSFISQQLKGLLPNSGIRLVDSKTLTGETPLFRALTKGSITVVKVRLRF